MMKTTALMGLVSGAAAFTPASFARRTLAKPLSMGFDMEASIQKTKDMRLAHLEDQAKFALSLAVENHENCVFPNALIAGDCVITHLLGELG
jgi:phosphoadenosine phosphosulfate reductase